MPIFSTFTEPGAAPLLAPQHDATEPHDEPAAADERYEGAQKFKHAYDKLGFGLKVRAQFYTSMAEFADAGIPPNTSLGDMAEVARRRTMQHSRFKIYEDIRATLGKGRGLPAALAPWIPSQEATTLAGAESAGPMVLRQIMREMGTLLTRQATARQKMLKALGGGAVGLLIMFGVIYEVISTLVPVFKSQITPALAAKIPFTAIYFAICGWLVSNIIPIVVFLILWSILTVVLIPTWTAKPRRFFDQYIPPFSLYQRVQATLFLSTTASMMRAGITLRSVLDDMGKFGSRWMRYHVAAMKVVLDAGEGEVAAIAVGPLPNDAADALQVYQRVPRFQDVMTRLAEANFAAYERSIAIVSGTITASSALLMTVFGGSTVIAMFQFSDAMRAGAMAVQHAAGG